MYVSQWGDGRAARLAGGILTFTSRDAARTAPSTRSLALGARIALRVLIALVSGCGQALVPLGGESPPTLDLTIPDLNDAETYHETDANDLLDLAESIPLEGEGRLIEGRVSSAGDVDVFDLGPVAVGDHVVVSLDADASFQGAIAVFDDTGSTLLVNDHRNVYLGRNGPFIDVVFRRPSTSCWVALATTPGYNSTGDYVMTAYAEPSTSLPEPRPDVILLDFEAASSVRIGSRPAINVPAFDAADISESFEGTSDDMAARVVAMVREDFAAYDVTVLSTTEGAEADETTSTIYFGTFDEALLGVAEGVDEYNARSGQSAIVFTDTFAAFAALRPSVPEMAQALANVASHEIGHLLGLVHTSNADDLMDVTASLKELLADQEFAKSPLYSAVFPVGYQDSVQSLLDSVGGDVELARAKSEGAIVRGTP